MPCADLTMMDVECETLKVKVGTLTIEAASGTPGQAVLCFGAKIRFDGKEPPIAVRRIELIIDVDDVVRVVMHGYPREAK